MDLLFIYTAIRAALTDVWALARRYWIAIAAVLALIAAESAAIADGTLLGVVLAGWFLVATAINTLWWWYGWRSQQARIRSAEARRENAQVSADYYRDMAELQNEALTAATGEIASLRERNTMLTGLVGGGQR